MAFVKKNLRFFNRSVIFRIFEGFRRYTTLTDRKYLARLAGVAKTGQITYFKDGIILIKGAWLLEYLERWTPVKADPAQEGIQERMVDRVFTDMPEPWTMEQAVLEALRPGGLWVSYVPTVPQLTQQMEAISAAADLCLAECFELCASGLPIAVTDDQGRLRGTVDPLSVFDVLAPDKRTVQETAASRQR